MRALEHHENHGEDDEEWVLGWDSGYAEQLEPVEPRDRLTPRAILPELAQLGTESGDPGGIAV
ncbi:MAG: hypothetical protein ACRDG4_01780, partial [Chloroflexota bacterium]